MKKIAIVIVAYNRVKSLERLLNSLDKVIFSHNNVTLIISIDNSGSTDVASFAKGFKWSYGEKEVIEHEKRLGLRNHVIFCGNLSKDYDAIVVLEDDIFVSKYFYNFILQSIDKYDSNNNIAGISLYTHLWNVGVNRPFIPAHNGKDAYFLQYAQSWGQVWTKRMWTQFYNWYLENESKWNKDVLLPQNILNWPDSSWLKYFISYIVKTEKYFVYPYISLATNFTDAGTHNTVSNSSYQVPLLNGDISIYDLPDFNSDSLRYDVFFESEKIWEYLDIPKEDICIDLYGNKNNEYKKRYWLTSKHINFKIVKEYALQLRPHELNIIYNIKGKGIFLYDTLSAGKNLRNKSGKLLEISQTKFDIRDINIHSLYQLLRFEIIQNFKRKLKKVFKLTNR